MSPKIYDIRMTEEMEDEIREFASRYADDMNERFEKILEEERKSAEKCAQAYVAFGR